MVARSGAPCQTEGWRGALRRAYRAPLDLLADLGLDARSVPELDPEPGPFGFLVPRGFAALMTPGDPTDPLLRQVLPLRAEREESPGCLLDPVGDGPATAAPGLLVKYAGRALLMAHPGCAVHCRYCFRRHFPYEELGSREERIERALAHLAGDSSLTEAVLSGGDPLMLDDDALCRLIGRLESVPTLRRLRLHTRLPVVLPERVTGKLCELLRGRRLKVAVVIHTNHARELGSAAQSALAELGRAGATLLNQSVLLAGVNDSAAALAELGERLFECGALPYYLHQLDPVQGAAHFAVPDETAVELMRELRSRLPGYLVPRLVREIAGETCKRPLG